MKNREMIQDRYGMDIGCAPTVKQQKYAPTTQVNMRKRVRKAQNKAKWMGFFYFLGTLALLALACLGMFSYENKGATEYLWILTFWKPFLDITNGFTLEVIKPMIKPLIYTIMLLVLLINFFRCFGKFGWLYKKKASRTYGFNRNAFAMEDLGRIFSGSFFAVILFSCVLYLTGYQFTLMAYIAVGVGFFFHFWCGLVGGNVSLFTARGGVEEEKRRFGRFAPFIRNLFQFAAVAGIAWFFLEMNTLNGFIGDLFKTGDFAGIANDLNALIVAAIELVMVICWLVLVKHATASTEFDRDGSQAAGMHNFRVFTFFIFLLASGLVAVEYFLMNVGISKNLETIYIAVIALVSFILECCLRRFPKVKGKIKRQEAFEAQCAMANAPQSSRIPLHCFTQPGLITYGGQQYMVMPMSLNAPGMENATPVEYYFVEEEAY